MHSVCGIRSITSSRGCRNERRPLVAGVGQESRRTAGRQPLCFFALGFFAVALLDERDDFALTFDLLDLDLLAFALLDFERDACAELLP